MERQDKTPGVGTPLHSVINIEKYQLDGMLGCTSSREDLHDSRGCDALDCASFYVEERHAVSIIRGPLSQS